MQRSIGSVLVLVVLATLGAACSRRSQPNVAPTPPATAAAPVTPAVPPAPPAPAQPPTAAGALSEDELFARKTLAELNAERPLGMVFFDYDQWNLRADATATLQRHAEWLRRWPSTQVAIEGHADERGTREYNLALGERRAHAIRAYLVSLGIPDARFSVVTKGREEPLCFEGVESCWQENRRGQFVFTAK